MNPAARCSRLLRLCLQMVQLATCAVPAVASAADNDAPILRPTLPAVTVAQQAPTTAASGPTVASAFASTPAAASEPTPTSAPTPRLSPTEPTHELKDERLPHHGFVLDVRVGVGGCVRSICADSHRASPGLRLDGFVGGNIRGRVDLGISGGWGNYAASVETNTNVLRLYGIEPARLQLAANATPW